MGVGWLETTGQFPFWGKKDMEIKPQPRSRAVLFVGSRAGSSGWAALPQSGENPTADKTSADNTLLITFRPHPPPERTHCFISPHSPSSLWFRLLNARLNPRSAERVAEISQPSWCVKLLTGGFENPHAEPNPPTSSAENLGFVTRKNAAIGLLRFDISSKRMVSLEILLLIDRIAHKLQILLF